MRTPKVLLRRKPTKQITLSVESLRYLIFGTGSSPWGVGGFTAKDQIREVWREYGLAIRAFLDHYHGGVKPFVEFAIGGMKEGGTAEGWVPEEEHRREGSQYRVRWRMV